MSLYILGQVILVLGFLVIFQFKDLAFLNLAILGWYYNNITINP